MLDYDTSRFEFIAAKSLRTGVNLVTTKQLESGKQRFILASEGILSGVTGNPDLMEITMRAKDSSTSGTGRISISQATVADETGNEQSASLSTVQVEIAAGMIGDVNGDGKVSIGDLALAAAAYGMTSESPGWSQVKRADLNGDNKIDISDLAAIAHQILK